jgi:hypothetical protein
MGRALKNVPGLRGDDSPPDGRRVCRHRGLRDGHLGLLNGLIIGNGLLKDAFDNNEPFKV